ncbi:MAG: S8 family peptidase [Lachnospiraceae bacterium]|nr:S8 family peptidase [Lachnospiraceae bacterium]
MDSNNTICSSYIYSDSHLALLIKYDNDLNGVIKFVNPECVDVINSRFLVAYRKAFDVDKPEEFFQFGYGGIPKIYGLMDMSAVEDIGAYAVRNLPGLNLTGDNVVIGFVDTGIDYRSPVFLDRQGRSRIRYIWDQGEEVYGKGPTVFGYGAEFTGEDINRAIASDNPYEIVPSRDLVGHGTYMASLAAGLENLEDNFSGVAPESEIIMVKLKSAPKILQDFYYIDEDKPCYSEVDIVQGIRYLVQKAVQLSKPMVICLGMGTNQGGHDGNSNLELYMEALSGLRGICFVAPAGNELGGRHHYSGTAILYNTHRGFGGERDGVVEDTSSKNENPTSSFGSETVEINVEENVLGFTMEIWGNAPGLLKLSVISPTGERQDGPPPNESTGIIGDFVFEGSSVFMKNVVVESETGDQLLFLRFDKPAQGIWRIEVSETVNQLGGGFNMWLPIEDFIGDKATFIMANPFVTVSSPGNGRGCITVAAYNDTNGAIYARSGRGFTRKGRVKPDITAPGVLVKGVFATSSEGVLYSERSGSSVATSLTAGAAALMLEWGIVRGNNPAMNTENIKQLFIRGARRTKENFYPSEIWGWGILDILQTFQNIRQ